MKTCIKNSIKCLGRDSREFDNVLNNKLCCRDELEDEIEIVQNIIDAIDEYAKDKKNIYIVSSKLSYGASVINKNEDENLAAVLDISKQFSLLLHEFEEKIIEDSTISDLVYSFSGELQKWFSQHFLNNTSSIHNEINLNSIIADFNTLEIALGISVNSNCDDSLDDLFF